MPKSLFSRMIEKMFGTKPAHVKDCRPIRARASRLCLELLESRTLLSASPFVESIIGTRPAGLTTNASSVSYAVTFSEAVTGVDPTDFQVAKTGTIGTTLVQVTPAGPASVYTVTVSGITGNGTLGLNLVDNGTVHDAAGNLLTTFNAAAAFQTQQTFTTGTRPFSVALGDVNGDGIPDIVIANEGSDTVSVLLGNGNGTFQPQQTFATEAEPWSVTLGDVNGDGKPDIVVANRLSDTVSVLLGNGNGTFQTQRVFATGSRPVSVTLGDVNGDGKPDLVVANSRNYSGGSYTVSVLLGNGDVPFKPSKLSPRVCFHFRWL